MSSFAPMECSRGESTLTFRNKTHGGTCGSHYKPPTTGLTSPVSSSESLVSRDPTSHCKLQFVCPKPPRATSKFCRPSCSTPPIRGGFSLSDDEREFEESDNDDDLDDYETKDGFEEDEDSDVDNEDDLAGTKLAARVKGRNGASRKNADDDAVFDLQD